MGSCLSFGNGKRSQDITQNPRHGALRAGLLVPDPGQFSAVCLSNIQLADEPKGPQHHPANVSATGDSLQAPSQSVPPGGTGVPSDNVSAANRLGSLIVHDGRPKPSFCLQDSKMSEHSETMDLEPQTGPMLPALPTDVQLPSASVTPAGNVLMQLNRAAILRNRMAGPLQPLPPKPPHLLASSESAYEAGGVPGPSGMVNKNGILPQFTTPPDRAIDAPSPNASGGPFPSGITGTSIGVGGGGDSVYDSGVLDGLGGLPTGASSSNAVSASTPPINVDINMTRQSLSLGADSLGAHGTTSGMSGTIGSTTVSIVSPWPNGAASNFTSQLCGLGVEATLSEMQQMALIGSGGGGCVYLGGWRGVTVAIKFIVSSDDDQLTRSGREALLSRLASHPHVVQTYATSVTQLTETMFKAKGGEPGDASLGDMTAADANISHDVLAGLTTGSWIRGEVQMAMGNGAFGCPPATQGAPVNNTALPTIVETIPSSAESGSVTASGRGGATTYNSAAAPGYTSQKHMTTYESEEPVSSCSTMVQARVTDAVSAQAAMNVLAPGQTGMMVKISDDNSATNSSLGCDGCGAPPPRLLQTIHACRDQGGSLLAGASGSLPMSMGSLMGASSEAARPAPEGPCSSEGSRGRGRDGSRQDNTHPVMTMPTMEDTHACNDSTSRALALAKPAGQEASEPVAGGVACTPESSCSGRSEVEPGAGAAAAGAGAGQSVAEAGKVQGARPAPGTAASEAREWCPLPLGGANHSVVGDSFDASFVRDHRGRTKYSIHEVLRQLGAHEGQFLTMVVMEYCDGGSLLAALREGPFHRDTTSWSPRMWLRSTVRTALDIAHGMQHLHLSGLVHGDLKPGNVLLKGSTQDKRNFIAKVSDLGITHPLGTADEMTIEDGQIGSIAYMAPEVFRGRIMKASDVYSFGVLLWQLACGTGAAPFEGAHPIAIALGVSEGKMALRWPPGVFRPLQQLGELCLQTDPAARPSFKSVVGALEKLDRHMQRLTTATAVGGKAGEGSPGGGSAAASGIVPSPSSSAISIPMHSTSIQVKQPTVHGQGSLASGSPAG